MNWDSQLDTSLTTTDNNMAKIKERLYSIGEVSKGDYRFDLAQVRKTRYEDVPPKPASPYTPTPYAAPQPVSSEDLVNLSSQLLSQAKMITSLHQAIGRLERDRDLHLQRIQNLEDEVRRMGAARGDVSESLLERKVNGLRQELSSDLRHLQDRVKDSPVRVSSPSLRSTASILQEVNENKRLIWKEYESLRRDTDYLHQRLRRQEDDLLHQISEGQELKRAQEKNAMAVERLLCSHQTHTQELDRVTLNTHGVQRDLLQIRSAISDLKEDVRIVEGKVSAHKVKSDRSEQRRSARRHKISKSSSSEDTRSQISLGDISSEDTSYSLGVPDVSGGSRATSGRDRKTRSSLSDLSDDLEGLSDSPPELNFSDL
ncbi:coiled-coil domain-containing protein 159 [Mixophyes fleayi]|uniref:coiled-coil domain-containing protein 159 n=1 Tax=Mixophyes fleayi TaxID=3061075 RepID=UPI003F4D805F